MHAEQTGEPEECSEEPWEFECHLLKEEENFSLTHRIGMETGHR